MLEPLANAFLLLRRQLLPFLESAPSLLAFLRAHVVPSSSAVTQAFLPFLGSFRVDRPIPPRPHG